MNGLSSSSSDDDDDDEDEDEDDDDESSPSRNCCSSYSCALCARRTKSSLSRSNWRLSVLDVQIRLDMFATNCVLRINVPIQRFYFMFRFDV
jgi:hypothetical protein